MFWSKMVKMLMKFGKVERAAVWQIHSPWKSMIGEILCRSPSVFPGICCHFFSCVNCEDGEARDGFHDKQQLNLSPRFVWMLKLVWASSLVGFNSHPVS
ncbi:Hypothetical predicted protein [Octopus vulgaris]|uniref:Uncharacterized protein n=1 Tax=Octopus vulgaris TaxID=6645 RepID=A0AA36FGE2_OCTVU|nr:Hypothetical predicted protein [Octopus vulgaris]